MYELILDVVGADFKVYFARDNVTCAVVVLSAEAWFLKRVGES